jgi:hypothetical protein
MPCKHTGGAEIKVHSFLTLAPDVLGCRHHTPRTSRLGKRPGTHWTGGWVGLRARIDGYGKPRSDTDSKPETSSPQRVAIQNEIGWLWILDKSTNNNWHNSIITLIKVVLTNKNCLLTVYQVYTIYGPCVACGPLELTVRPVTILEVFLKKFSTINMYKSKKRSSPVV